MTLASDSVWKDPVFYKWCVAPIIIIILILTCLHFFVLQPAIDNMEQTIKEKTNAEHDKLLTMDCKSLGNWLLQDDVYAHDNLIWAQNHYLVSCK